MPDPSPYYPSKVAEGIVRATTALKTSVVSSQASVACINQRILAANRLWEDHHSG
uniref:Uncharacterized protein n=1 Tax=Moniliophthora roreri TaxID=221103 RepID=A0A0W0F3P7_MONRR